jgi:hypothetical protein
MVWGNHERALHDGAQLCRHACIPCDDVVSLPCHVDEFPCRQLCKLMQTSSVTAGATGIWQRIGNGWHVSNLPASLKKVSLDNFAVNKETVATGAANLPLRLGFIGHEGCTHTVKDFQRIRADMRDCVSQVGHNTIACILKSCPT